MRWRCSPEREPSPELAIGVAGRFPGSARGSGRAPLADGSDVPFPQPRWIGRATAPPTGPNSGRCDEQLDPAMLGHAVPCRQHRKAWRLSWSTRNVSPPSQSQPPRVGMGPEAAEPPVSARAAGYPRTVGTSGSQQWHPSRQHSSRASPTAEGRIPASLGTALPVHPNAVAGTSSCLAGKTRHQQSRARRPAGQNGPATSLTQNAVVHDPPF